MGPQDGLPPESSLASGEIPDNVIHLAQHLGTQEPVLFTEEESQGAPERGDCETPEPALLAAAVEAVLFTLGAPAPLARLQDYLGGPETSDLLAALRQLRATYDREGHGIHLVEVAGGWQIRTHPRFATWVARARGGRPFRLSRAALETLAIVAWKQPVTRAQIEQVRGVDPGPVLRMLLDRGLVRALGHLDEPGRPMTFGTTPRFLETFALKDLSDLPTLRDRRDLGEAPPED